MPRPMSLLLSTCLLLLLPGACRRESGTPTAAVPVPPPPAQPVAGTPVLKDVVEHDPRYLVGISYPAVASEYPGLAAALKRYADAAHAELMQAVEGLGADKPTAPYDLSLSFNEIARTPRLLAIAADGSSYTGGAHGNPLVARFVWLLPQDKQLTISELIPDKQAWEDVSDYAREQLHAALSQRVDADDLPPAERADIVKNAGRMIDEGTGPEPGNFEQFEPVLAPDGKIAALRFVFAPYQVGPYADGTQTVDIPADVLLPKVAPAYRNLFAGG
jgi:hypothetical protein